MAVADVFIYRQFIELELKYLIATYGFTVGIKANWKSRDIAFLWSEFVKVLAGFGVEDPDETDSVVSSIVAEFAKVSKIILISLPGRHPRQ
jgi:hypothetical protein